jgi:hypothetical protein
LIVQQASSSATIAAVRGRVILSSLRTGWCGSRDSLSVRLKPFAAAYINRPIALYPRKRRSLGLDEEVVGIPRENALVSLY